MSSQPGRRRRNPAEVAVDQVLDLVVVVEHDAAEAGDAEVLEQQIAGEDVDRGELLQRVAVLAHRVRALRVVGVLEVEVERDHPPLDVEVPDDDVVALELDHRRRHRQELGDQLVGEALAREGDVGVFEDVGHAPDAIVVLDQPVLLP